jgi:phosphoribosylformylglycinamidine cyclo-ligase
VIRKGSWDVPPIFSFLQQAAKISDHEMRRTFNNGIGMAVIVSEKDVQDVLERLNGMKEKAVVIGEIIKKKKSDPRVQWI